MFCNYHVLYCPFINSFINYSVVLLSTEQKARGMSAFVAAGVRDGSGNKAYQSGDRLLYLNTHVNPGGHYNNTSGEYSCGKTGVYYFTFSIYGYEIADGSSNSVASASLMKDSVLQGEVLASNKNKEHIYISLSQLLVVLCNAGEKVWVQSTHSNNFIHAHSNTNVFAGFLLSMN